MKYLIVLLVVGIGLWLLLRARGGGAGAAGGGAEPRRRRGSDAAEAMVECAHCRLHVPRGDAVVDAAGRSFCTEAHRLAGPR